MADNWYKDAIIYEVHVRAFFDGRDDGMGDFAGLSEKLDYLQDLGVTALWLLPFFPSPWKDDGYDISDYNRVHPAYGSLRDLQAFLRGAHARGLKVIGELVLNHTSDQHQWFQRARRSRPGSRWRNFYVWSDTPERYRDARIIFKDFEADNWTWDPVAKAYYWHRFYSHQPDLNYDSPDVRAAMLQAVDFWLDMGLDGLRLDAVPYLYEREGTNCENLAETHGFLKQLRAHIDSRYGGTRMILAEANQWPEDAIAYFGSGDECHMAFHFPLMPRLFMALRMEDRFPIAEILRSTPPIPESCQWALFLRNHDELTLEMVTDEERDYMYRVYARDRHMRINLGIRRRLAPLLENDRRRIELMNALLLSLPGTPVVYYGDEIGMGDNVYLGDRNGVRTPMQWSADRNAGFSRANPQGLYLPVIIDPEYHYEAINVETQQNNPHSLLWWMKRAIAQRRESRAFGRGGIEVLYPENRRIFAFLRSFDNEHILVVANLSRFAQYTEIDLSRFQGQTPVEMFGRAEFSPITDRPWPVSLGPHAFYWFLLQSREAPAQVAAGAPPVFRVADWAEVFSGEVRLSMKRLLPAFLRARRWFLGRTRSIRRAEIDDIVPVAEASAFLLLIRVEYREGEADLYLLPLAVLAGEEADRAAQQAPEFVMARLEGPHDKHGVLFGALRHRAFNDALLTAIARRRRYQGEKGELVAAHTRDFRRVWGTDRPALDPATATGDQDNTTIFYGDRFSLKLFRRLEAGPHPEREIGEALGSSAPFIPAMAGSLEYRRGDADATTVGVLRAYMPGQTDGWKFAMDHLGLFFEHVLTLSPAEPPPSSRRTLLALAAAPDAEAPREPLSTFLEMIRTLGRRAAELHLALAAAFEPEPYTDFYRVGLYHGILGQATRVLQDLRQRLSRLPDEVRGDVERLLAREGDIRGRFHALRSTRIQVLRIRQHGAFELRNVLYTGKDFVILDLEGDPTRSLGERRIQRSSLNDVASMLRSFHYAAHAVLYGQVPGVITHRANVPLEDWADYWYRSTGAAFLAGYLYTPGIDRLLPSAPGQLPLLLDTFLLDLALQDAGRELLQRPDWLRIPVRGITDLLDTTS